ARGQADASNGKPSRRAGWKEYRHLLYIPSYVLDTLGMTAMTFALGGLAYWLPKYLVLREQSGEATGIGGMSGRTLFGVVVVVSGLLATLAGGAVGDRLRERFSGSYFLVSGVAMILGFPF